jgi:DNA ligase (NAD+)
LKNALIEKQNRTEQKQIKMILKIYKINTYNPSIIIPSMASIATTTDEILLIIKNFKRHGISCLEQLSHPHQQDVLSKIIILSNNLYYNSTEKTETLLTDNEYDIVKEYFISKYPSNQLLKAIGAPSPSGKNKVKLPYEMWSMDKIKPDTNALTNWVTKYSGPYVISCKLDGVSGLYTTTGATPKLYTRGDGVIGQDVSHLLESDVLKLPKQKGLVVRGEFIIPKEVFDKKYADKFANPRNLTAGIVNSKTVDDKTCDMRFVTYECIVPDLTPSKQLDHLTKAGFEVVNYQVCTSVSNEKLSSLLIEHRKSYTYEIDGIIVSNDKIYQRTSSNPDHAFAFKMVLSDQTAEAKVIDVLWEPSKDGYLKPRVRIEPINLCGVTISFATGYNAKYIEENKIGVGAVIELIRSGDVIPKITRVNTPADVTKMPSVPYTWNETHVDVLLDNASDNLIVREKNIVAFFTEIEVEGLKGGNVRKIMEAGYDTISKILAMKKSDFEKVGFKTTAIKYETNIKEKVANASLVQIMVASGTLGRGIGAKKIQPVLTTFPDIIVSKESDGSKIVKLTMLDGIEQKTAQLFVNNIPNLIQFLKETGLEYKLDVADVNVSVNVSVNVNVACVNVANPSSAAHPLFGKDIVMTKVRDKAIIESLDKYGAKLVDNITKNTFVLIVKSTTDVSNKTKYAEQHNIPIMTPEQFTTNYLSQK